MSSNLFGNYDAATEVDPQRDLVPPNPLDFGHLRAPRMSGPAALRQENEDGEPGEPGLAPEENHEPPVRLAHLLQGMPVPVLLLQSHLPVEDLERVVEYVAHLGHEAGLPIDEIERAMQRLLILGIHNRWDVDTIHRAARVVVHTIIPLDEPQCDAGDEHALIHPAENAMAHARNDPPPQYVREPAAHHNVIEGPARDRRTQYSTKLEVNFQAEVVLLFTPLYCIAFGVLVGLLLAILQQIHCQPMIGCEQFFVGLGAGSFATTPAFIDVLSIIIKALLLAHIAHTIASLREARIHGGRS